MSNEDLLKIAEILLTHRFQIAATIAGMFDAKTERAFYPHIQECRRLEQLCRDEALK